jgi:protein-disulfide isomerase
MLVFEALDCSECDGRWNMRRVVLLAATALFSLTNIEGQSPITNAQAPATGGALIAQPQVSPQQIQGDGITREQADAILKELRAIRLLLERQAQSGPTRPQTPVANRIGKVKIGGSSALGHADAPVTIVEYTDYQCPHCGRFHASTFEELKKNYIDTGKIQFISRDLPLSFHQHALKAAQAARCAGEQDKFWQMRDLMIRNSNNLDDKAILNYAQRAQLDADKFSVCINGDRYIDEIRRETAEANSVGITGTPSFIVGRRREDSIEGDILVGALSYATLEARIQELLASKP